MTKQMDKIRLSLAGEYGVASELLKRGFDVNITIGHAKAMDILVSNVSEGQRGFKSIEVKTSRNKKFVTNFFQKYITFGTPHPDFWVIVHIDKTELSHYYILTHEEMAKVQMAQNKMSSWHAVPNGCDNVLLSQINMYENKWDSIIL